VAGMEPVLRFLVADLRIVPNQPPVLTGDGDTRYEDAIIMTLP